MKQYVYLFREGNKDMKEILGGKGANLAEMTQIGLPVPQGFIISTEACNEYYHDNEFINTDIEAQIFEKLEQLESMTGKKLGDPKNPLLLSVRSGARVSMPGMMDTILNLGLNDEVASNFAEITDNPRFVYDSYRRLISMFADVVRGYDRSKFEETLTNLKKERKVSSDLELDAADYQELVERYKKLYLELDGNEFPTDPKSQLLEAVGAVFRSWNTERAEVYRSLHNIPSTWGTAVNVQEMVYGNRGENSGTGVAFTRNPATGEKMLYGEYLINAQGEDVVAGIRTPESIDKLKEDMPEVYEQFLKNAELLETHYKDMQDMEFTIENGTLYMLQTRNGKRTAAASLKIALDMIKEGLITEKEGILRVNPNELDQLLHPSFDPEVLESATIITKGLAASPGAGSGKIYFTAEDAAEAHKNGEAVILVREETSPEDIIGMNVSEAIVTVHGGMTSHAAVVARGMGKCCVSGCSDLTINVHEKTMKAVSGKVYHEGDFISVDGTAGAVYDGQIDTIPAKMSNDFEEFMDRADQYRKLGVKVNADTVKDAEVALSLGAEGIGLCRTEHMFFASERIFYMRAMILAETKDQRIKALESLLKFQREDFIGLFRVMTGRTVTIRYLDPPLHEFLPKTEDELIALADELDMTFEELYNRVVSLRELNPMMGHRGCRLDVTYPEIAIMQTKAIMEAAAIVAKDGFSVSLELMIPLITDIKELSYVKQIIVNTIEKLDTKSISYKIGTMMETPRACLLADEIAKEAEFFSFGTNDLTQLSYGFSRDDASKFLNDYYRMKIFEQDPFKQIDENGVGLLMDYAVHMGKKIRPNMNFGICGEHGGDPASIAFCDQIGLTYVSCSPYRVPTARLAAAQARIKE